jgi:murein DD-endopeptidase MepM/ murein hydrolase activator NlpD/CBS domain-containing protein
MFFIKKASHKTKIFLKTTIITALAASVVAFSNGPVAFASNSKLTTVYYVYLNHTYIGTVSDTDIVEKRISEKTDTLKQNYKNVNLNVNPTVEYVPEQVFQSTADNQQTLENLDQTMTNEVDAAAITVDGKPVVYVDSKSTADEVIEKLKTKYVTEAQLTELEARKAANTPLPALKENETRLLDVRFSKTVSVTEDNVAPNQIMSADNAIAFLQKGTLEEKKYAVQEGDVLGSIANSHDLKLAELLALNPGLTEDSLLKIGQEINITAVKPFLDVVVELEAQQSEAIPYQTLTENNASMPKGETTEKQAGKNGLKSVNYHIVQQNGAIINKKPASVEVLSQPVNHIIIKGTKVIPSHGDGSFAWPTVGGYISSTVGYRWGKMHKGIDIARPSNRTIKAADNGTVEFAGWGGEMGNKVIINHHNGFKTVYAHLSSISVHAGQTVSKGSHLGIMGATGDATGVHLHFEVYKNGQLQNPLSYLR